MRVLQLFGGGGRNAVQTLIAHRMLPNGDWRDTARVTMWVSSAVRDAHTDRPLKAMLAYGVDYALAFSPPLSLPLDGPRVHLGCARPLGDDAWFVGTCVFVIRSFFQELISATSCRPDCRRHTLGSLAHRGHAPGAANAGGTSWQEENEKSRSQGLRFVQGKHAAVLVMMRLVFEPLRFLLARKLAVADEQWEADEREQLRAANDVAAPARSRTYRALLFATSSFEHVALKKVRVLLEESDYWTVIPESAQTEKWQARASGTPAGWERW